MINKLVVAAIASVLIAGCTKPPSPTKESQSGSPQTAQPVAAKATGNVEITPQQPKAGEKVTIKMTLNDPSGKPIPDADVKAVFVMAMGKSEMRDQTTLKWNGKEYSTSYSPMMAGTWEIAVEARKDSALILSMPARVSTK